MGLNCAMFGSIRWRCWQDILLVLSEKALGSHRLMHGALGKRAKSVCRMSISGLMSLFPTFLCSCSTLILYAREQNTYDGNRKNMPHSKFQRWWNSWGFNCVSILGSYQNVWCTLLLHISIVYSSVFKWKWDNVMDVHICNLPSIHTMWYNKWCDLSWLMLDYPESGFICYEVLSVPIQVRVNRVMFSTLRSTKIHKQ